MRHLSKTTATLRRLQRSTEIRQETIERCSSESTAEEPNSALDMTPIQEETKPEEKKNVIEFHPHELDEYTPLKPEEADDHKLIRLFQNHDLSFLFDSTIPPTIPSDEVSLSSVQTTRASNTKKRRLWQHSWIPTEDDNQATTDLRRSERKRSRST